MLNAIAIPFGYLMRAFYQITGNYAVALVLFAVLVKLVMLPLSIRQQKSSIKQAQLRPKERAIRKRYAGRTDNEARVQMATELQQMYTEEHYSVAGGCLPLLIQFPIIIILYRIVQNPLTYISRLAGDTVTAIQTKVLELVQAGSITVSGLTAESTAVSEIQATAAIRDNLELFSDLVSADTLIPELTFGGVDLATVPTFAFTLIAIFPILAGAFQWLSSFIMKKLMPAPASDSEGEKTPEAASAESTMKMMNIVMPLLTVFIAFKLPAIMSLYWVYQSILGIITQVLLYKLLPIPVFSEEYYAQVEEEMNRDYVPIPAPRMHTNGSSRSLHHIDDDDDIDASGDTDEGEADDCADNELEDNESGCEDYCPTFKPKQRYDKNGNPIRSLHYIDFDDEDVEKSKVDSSDALNSEGTCESSDTDDHG